MEKTMCNILDYTRVKDQDYLCKQIKLIFNVDHLPMILPQDTDSKGSCQSLNKIPQLNLNSNKITNLYHFNKNVI